jgi:hypothetical protein
MNMTLQQRSLWANAFNIRSQSDYAADIRLEKKVTESRPMIWKDGQQVVEITKDISYEIIYQGTRIGTISKAWMRTGGSGWGNTYFQSPNMPRQTGTYKNLDQAIAGAANALRSADLFTNMQTAGVKL